MRGKQAKAKRREEKIRGEKAKRAAKPKPGKIPKMPSPIEAVRRDMKLLVDDVRHHGDRTMRCLYAMSIVVGELRHYEALSSSASQELDFVINAPIGDVKARWEAMRAKRDEPEAKDGGGDKATPQEAVAEEAAPGVEVDPGDRGAPGPAGGDVGAGAPTLNAPEA